MKTTSRATKVKVVGIWADGRKWSMSVPQALVTEVVGALETTYKVAIETVDGNPIERLANGWFVEFKDGSGVGITRPEGITGLGR